MKNIMQDIVCRKLRNRIVKLICKFLVIVGFGCILVFGSTSSYAQSKDGTKQASFEQQMSDFKELGFELNKGASESDLIEMWGKEAFESTPYSLLYITLGGQIEKEPWTPITDQCWHFDTESIEGPGSYVSILDNLKRISNGELDFKDASDIIDWDNQNASVSFVLNGDRYNWDLEFYDDWVDPYFMSRIVQLSEKYETKGRLTYYDTGGQDLVIGWSTPERLKKLESETGLTIGWLH